MSSSAWLDGVMLPIFSCPMSVYVMVLSTVFAKNVLAICKSHLLQTSINKCLFKAELGNRLGFLKK